MAEELVQINACRRQLLISMTKACALQVVFSHITLGYAMLGLSLSLFLSSHHQSYTFRRSKAIHHTSFNIITIYHYDAFVAQMQFISNAPMKEASIQRCTFPKWLLLAEGKPHGQSATSCEVQYLPADLGLHSCPLLSLLSTYFCMSHEQHSCLRLRPTSNPSIHPYYAHAFR